MATGPESQLTNGTKGWGWNNKLPLVVGVSHGGQKDRVGLQGWPGAS